MCQKNLNKTNGQTIVLYALTIIVLFGFGALAIDIGHIYHVKNQLQVAADAAALAGANELDGSTFRNQSSARSAALRVGFKNLADVAYADVPTAKAGQPIPVTLRRNDNNADINGDVVTGNWDGTSFTAATSDGSTVNAVQVIARRAGAIPEQPNPQNFFARVFKLLGANFDFASVNARAIASKGVGLPFLPIAVNEYWNEGAFNNKTNSYPTGSPYNQKYPESFMRKTNADGVTAGRAGQIFAVLGQNANSNQSSFDLNSFVDVLLRNERHAGTASGWHTLPATATGTCTDCSSGFPSIPGVTSGAVNSTKFDPSFMYLFTGIPTGVIPPDAVRELIRTLPNGYDFDNYSVSNGNDPSNCPYATIPYYSSSGNIPTLPKGPNGQTFADRYPKGSRFLVMVYDGTHTSNSDPSQANVVTVVGYGVIQVDGYASGNNFDGTPASLGARGNTAYGHAVPHMLTAVDPLVADVSDPFLIQPPMDPKSARSGSCSFTDLLKTAQSLGGSQVRLVGPNIRYGVR